MEGESASKRMVPDEEILLQARRFVVVRVSAGNRPKEIVRHPGAVVILPILPNDHVCLIRNYRVSVGDTLIELPAGTMEPPEPPQATAARELAEETGYRADRIELLRTFYPSPGVMDELMYLYLAEGLTGGPPAREAGEQIENFVVPWQEAMQMVDRGEIRDAKTLVGLLTYERIR